jgi:hypothetical protein
MTEAAPSDGVQPLPPGPRKLGSVGIPTGTEIAIMAETGALMPPETEGEIIVRGPNVMGGYIASGQVNATAFVGGWFRTGDQGRLDEDGYLFITGRIKKIINRGGEKISPREIDEVLLAHPAVAEAITFALPDARVGEDVGAAIVLRPESEGVDTRSLHNFAQTRLAPFKLPRRVLFVSQIPKGAAGKPQRIGLAKRLTSEEGSVSVEATGPIAPPSSTNELTLLALCREVFQLETIGIHEQLFESGGDADSLSAEMLLLEIERHWNVSVTIADLLAGPTIAEFARVIDTAGPARQAPQLAVIHAGGSRSPFFCLGAGPRFRELARLLGPEQPFLATVQPRHPRWIDDLAAYHLQIIRNGQPRGPYFVGGYRVIGLVAYEVAQRLRSLGERAEPLVLFDTSFCSSRLAAIYHEMEPAIEHLRRIGGLGWSAIFRKLLRRFGWGMSGFRVASTAIGAKSSVRGADGWRRRSVIAPLGRIGHCPMMGASSCCSGRWATRGGRGRGRIGVATFGVDWRRTKSRATIWTCSRNPMWLSPRRR